jgi:hypothetical protein
MSKETVDQGTQNNGTPGCFWLACIAAIVIIFGLLLYFDHRNKALEHDADIRALHGQVDGLSKRLETLERAHESTKR